MIYKPRSRSSRMTPFINKRWTFARHQVTSSSSLGANLKKVFDFIKSLTTQPPGTPIVLSQFWPSSGCHSVSMLPQGCHHLVCHYWSCHPLTPHPWWPKSIETKSEKFSFSKRKSSLEHIFFVINFAKVWNLIIKIKLKILKNNFSPIEMQYEHCRRTPESWQARVGWLELAS